MVEAPTHKWTEAATEGGSSESITVNDFGDIAKKAAHKTGKTTTLCWIANSLARPRHDDWRMQLALAVPLWQAAVHCKWFVAHEQLLHVVTHVHTILKPPRAAPMSADSLSKLQACLKFELRLKRPTVMKTLPIIATARATPGT
jgi:hypothetical protein